MEGSFSTDRGWRDGREGWFQDDSSALPLFHTSFLLLFHQVHLISSGIRSGRLGTPGVKHWQRTRSVMCSTERDGSSWVWPAFLAVTTWVDLTSMWSPDLVIQVLFNIRALHLSSLCSLVPAQSGSSPHWSYNTSISAKLHLTSNRSISLLPQILNPYMVPSGNVPHLTDSRVSISSRLSLPSSDPALALFLNLLLPPIHLHDAQ